LQATKAFTFIRSNPVQIFRHLYNNEKFKIVLSTFRATFLLPHAHATTHTTALAQAAHPSNLLAPAQNPTPACSSIEEGGDGLLFFSRRNWYIQMH
jgi:hypothetical protein